MLLVSKYLAQCRKMKNLLSPKNISSIQLYLNSNNFFRKTLLSRDFWQKFRESNDFTK